MEGWVAELKQGRPDAAWDLFLDRYRRLIFAAIRHYAQDYDDVMDVFARVCEALREDDLARLRCYAEQPFHGARFSTWLVTVVRHLTIDWFRHRNGRRRL
jgi:DNA-directed RNA polymerase specialized sigma24 family protein